MKLRGYKSFDGVSIIYEHTVYYGRNSMITIITGCKAVDFPTNIITKFVKSLKRKTS